MIQTGDRVLAYDGEEYVVRAVKCFSCNMGSPHENCAPFAQVAENKWINVECLEKL